MSIKHIRVSHWISSEQMQCKKSNKRCFPQIWDIYLFIYFCAPLANNTVSQRGRGILSVSCKIQLFVSMEKDRKKPLLSDDGCDSSESKDHLFLYKTKQYRMHQLLFLMYQPQKWQKEWRNRIQPHFLYLQRAEWATIHIRTVLTTQVVRMSLQMWFESIRSLVYKQWLFVHHEFFSCSLFTS